jgi:hypothetical protein
LVKEIVNLSTEDLWDEIYKGFNSKICSDCYKQAILSRDMSNPQPIPYVGPEFGKDQYSLFFCGIETYFNEKRKDFASVKYDMFPTSQVESLYFEKEPEKNNYSPFWKWVRRISEEVLKLKPSDTFKHIAYSNLIKCQSRRKGGDFFSSSYELSNELPTNCIKRAGWIYREIEKIEAKNVILFAGRAKELYLARLFLDDMEGKMIRKFDYSNCDLPEKILKKRKDRDLFIHLRDGRRRFILTNHPQGTPHEIRDEIVRIVGENDWTGSIEWKMPKTVAT